MSNSVTSISSTSIPSTSSRKQSSRTPGTHGLTDLWAPRTGRRRRAPASSWRPVITIDTIMIPVPAAGYGCFTESVTAACMSLAILSEPRSGEGAIHFAGVNGEGGISCAGAGSGISYLYLLNEQNQLELWWYDFDSSKPNDPKHPP